MFLDNITYQRETEHAFRGKYKGKADSSLRQMIKVVNSFSQSTYLVWVKKNKNQPNVALHKLKALCFSRPYHPRVYLFLHDAEGLC